MQLGSKKQSGERAALFAAQLFSIFLIATIAN
jgi:hypothetical protein